MKEQFFENRGWLIGVLLFSTLLLCVEGRTLASRIGVIECQPETLHFMDQKSSRVGMTYTASDKVTSGSFGRATGKIHVFDGKMAKGRHVLQFVIPSFSEIKKSDESLQQGGDLRESPLAKSRCRLGIIELKSWKLVSEKGERMKYQVDGNLRFNGVTRKVSMPVQLKRCLPKRGESSANLLEGVIRVAAKDFVAIAESGSEGEKVVEHDLGFEDDMVFEFSCRFYRRSGSEMKGAKKFRGYVWEGGIGSFLDYNCLLDLNGDRLVGTEELMLYLIARDREIADLGSAHKEIKRLFRVCPSFEDFWEIFSLPIDQEVPSDSWWHQGNFTAVEKVKTE